MGLNHSTAMNKVRSSITASVDMALNSSGGCNTTVSGSNIISVVGGKNVDISRVRQKVYLKLNTSCTISQVMSSKVKQDIEAKLMQTAEAITKGLGSNNATSSNITEAMMNLPVVIQSNIVAAVQTLVTSSNIITVQGTDGLNMDLIDQEVVTDVVTKSVVTQTMASDAGQKVDLLVDQAAKASATGLDLTLGLVVFIVLAIVGMVIFVSWKNTVATVLMSPMTWLLVVMPFLIGSMVLMVAGLSAKKVFWPYRPAATNDTAEEAEKKKTMNRTIVLAASITAAFLVILEAGLFYAMITRPPMLGSIRATTTVTIGRN